MRILELTGFSAGVCGVWNRVFEESKRLAKKHTVVVFSSNLVKGSDEIASSLEYKEGVKIQRFPAKMLGGESFMDWNFEEAALSFKPELIIAHCYRHTHTTKALKLAKKLKCRVFLVTHAPFDRDSTRTLFARWAVRFYDWFKGPRTIKQFSEVIAITKWEIPFLVDLGVDEHKIKYIPNGIPEEFFKQKKAKEVNKILFLGRVSPIKSLETMIEAMPLVEDKGVILEIVGPAEEEYLEKLKKMVEERGLENRVVFGKAIYNLKKKIEKIDSAKIFVLPSKREGMPQALIEAMARGKIVIASDIPAARDLIEDRRNGLLFNVGNASELARVIDRAEELGEDIRKEAVDSVKRFSWDKIIKEIEELI